MKRFTPTEFRADSSKVYNSVMIDGEAMIDHRDRPSMFLMTEEFLEDYVQKRLLEFINGE